MYRFPPKVYPNHLNDFARCPFKFFCANDPEVKVPFEGTSEVFVGSAMHAALKGFFRLPLHERRPERAGDLLRDAWSRLPKGFGYGIWSAADRLRLFGSPEQERACGLEAIVVLQNYLAGADLAAVPLVLQDWLHCEVGGVTLAGRIDRIDADGEHGIAVWDYKTGKAPYQKTAREMIEAGDYQLPVYAIIASHRYPAADTVRAGLIYVRTGQVYKVTWTREELETVTEDVLAFVSRIQAEREFKAQMNPLCPWCPYRDICPAKESIPDPGREVEAVAW